jgi:arabinose-5-phosphate isomerase
MNNDAAGQAQRALDSARRVLAIEAAAVAGLSARLDERFAQAVELILACQGRVVVSGMGKSGHIGTKIASTLASTGTPAFFVHPAEASHGDLGMITAQDVMIALSNSGESGELLAIVPLVKRRGARLIAVTGNPKSALAREADVHLDATVAEEACPLGLAPTASTTAALALGDALAVALLEARGFGAEDFARSHPGGTLGRRLLTHVGDIMRSGEAVPAVASDASLAQAVLEISRKGMGMTAILDEHGRVEGIFTDGDLRRALEKPFDLRTTPVKQVMTANPHTIRTERLAAEAVKVMEDHRISQILVVDADRRLVGALNMHDLFRAKVI